MASLDAKVRFPFAAAKVEALSATGAQAIAVVDTLTIIDGVSVEATGNRTINLTIDSEVIVGALLLVKSKTNGTETTIFGTGITAPTITGVAGKTKDQLFIYDGSAFVAAGAEIQID
jgi:hypothetical protein